MTSQIRFGYPDVPFRATTTTSSETVATSRPVKNLVSGPRSLISELASNATGQTYIEYDLGSGVTSSCDYLALLNAKILQNSGVTAVRLRGSSQSFLSPTTITGCKLWLDPTKLSTITYDSSNRIASITDRSGNGNTATQTTDANKPTLTVNSIQGNAVMTFTRANSQYLECNSLATTFSGSDKPLTLIAVVSQASLAANETLLSLSSTSSGTPYHQYYTNATQYGSFRESDGATTVSVVGGTPNTSVNIISWVFTGTAVSLYVNGTQIINASAQDVTALTLNRAIIGGLKLAGAAATDFMNGGIGDVIVYDTALSDTNRGIVESYLTAKWSNTPSVNLSSFSSTTLLGPHSLDYITTFTTSTAYRYWILEFDSTTPTARPLSKAFFGTLFDIGRDPNRNSSLKDEYWQDKGIYQRVAFELEFEGISNSKRQSFDTNIGKYSGQHTVLLYGTTYDRVVQDNTLMSARVLDYEFAATNLPVNQLKLSMEEVY